jgi:hypothetical protein
VCPNCNSSDTELVDMATEGARTGRLLGSVVGLGMAVVCPPVGLLLYLRGVRQGAEIGRGIGEKSAPRYECRRCGRRWKA